MGRTIDLTYPLSAELVMCPALARYATDATSVEVPGGERMRRLKIVLVLFGVLLATAS